MEKRKKVCKDFYGKEIHEGDKVVFIFKNFGYKKLCGAGFMEGTVKKLPTEEYREVATGGFKNGEYVSSTETRWVPNSETITVECSLGQKRVYPAEIIVK